MQPGLILHGVQMTPVSITGVMQFAFIMTFGAREPCPFFEIDEDVDPLLCMIDPAFADEPW